MQSVSERSAACSTDWRAYGVTDGQLGIPASDRTDFFEDCRKLGIPVDVAAYQAGRAEGLMTYCTAESGYQAGRERRKYDDVCTGQGDIAFRQGYARGREDRPRGGGGIYPTIGLGIGGGSRRTYGGIGIGVPLYYGGGYSRSGLPRFHDYCFYNSSYCRARGWY